MYFIDFNYFELYERSLTNESYRKSSTGPIPIHFDLAVRELIIQNKIGVKKEDDSSKIKYTVFSNPLIDFKKEELNLIMNVIDDLSKMNEKEINKFTLEDMPLKASEEGEIIDYGFVFYRDFKYQKRKYN
ncbi:MAG: DUF4065 domain-containing protein [Methanobrevibacter sp.]|nr:DUF4065 domain-containing protein [Methanobrevibacter sp.]